MVERPSRMSGSCREALPDVQKWSGGPPGCPGVVGRPYRMSGSGREAFRDGRKWSGGPPGCLRVVGRPFQRSESGREALPDVCEWSGDPPGSPGVLEPPSRMVWRPPGCLALSGCPPECPEVVGRHTRMSRSSREALPDVREWSRGPPG